MLFSYHTKMFNLDVVINENNAENNSKWSYIPDHLYKILITEGSGSGKQDSKIVVYLLTRFVYMLKN